MAPTTTRALCKLVSKEIFDRGVAEAFGEKCLGKIPPLLVAHHRDLGDILIMLGQEREFAPAALLLPAAEIFKNEQRTDFAATRIASRAAACTWLFSPHH